MLSEPSRLLAKAWAAKDTSSPVASINETQTHTWTNTKGKKIQAEFLSLSDNQVKLKLDSGKVYTLPLASLDSASKAQALELSGQ